MIPSPVHKALRFAAQYLPDAAGYLLVGGASALVEFAIFFCAVSVGLHYVPAAVLGFIMATACNYVLSARFLFRSRDRSVQEELVLIYACSAAAALVNLLVTAGLIELGGMGRTPTDLLAAKMAGTGLAFVLNYLARQFFIFDRRPRHDLRRLVAAVKPVPPLVDSLDEIES